MTTMKEKMMLWGVYAMIGILAIGFVLWMFI